MPPPPGSLRPEFGPPLSALLRGRRARLAALAAAGLAIAAAGAYALVRGSGWETVVHRGSPEFNLVFARDAVRRVPPRPGELVRLVTAGRPRATVTVRRLALPPYRGDVPRGLLPLVAERHVTRLRRDLRGLWVYEEGRARFGDAPGYQVAFRGRRGGRPVHGRLVLLVPHDTALRGGVALSFRHALPRRRPGPAARERIADARRALRSFRYGTDRS